MKHLLTLSLLFAAGCGKDAPSSVSGIANGEGRSLKVEWGIALWDGEEKKLILGFLESDPPAEKLAAMKENKSLFMGVFLEVPIIQITLDLAEKDGVPDLSSPRFWRILYNNFGDKGPMTLNHAGNNTDMVVEVTGNPTSGGRVTGRFKGKDSFEMTDDKRYYNWDITFDLIVH